MASYCRVKMGGGRLLVLVVSFIVGATSNILPFHRSDMFEISVDEEYDTIAERNTELLELDGFEIFGGFGYSNSLSDFGVPVVYTDVVNLQVIDEETLVNFEEQILDMEKETIGELEIENKYGNGIDDTSVYEEKVDQLEDEMIETVNNEVTDEEFKHESVLLEGNSYSPLDTGSKEDMIGDNLDEIEMPETEHNYIEETSAEYGDFKLDEESIIGEDEIHKPFPVKKYLGKTDNLVLDTSEGNMSENKDDISVSEREFENELGISGKDQICNSII